MAFNVNQLIISNIIAEGRRCARYYWTGRYFARVERLGGNGDTEGTQYWVTRENALYADDGVVVDNTYTGQRTNERHIADQV